MTLQKNKYYYGWGTTEDITGWYNWSHIEGPWDKAAQAAALMAIFVHLRHINADLLLNTLDGLRIVSRVPPANKNYFDGIYPDAEDINKYLVEFAGNYYSALQNILSVQ